MDSVEEMEEAAKKLHKLTGCEAVLVKGGHLAENLLLHPHQEQRPNPALSTSVDAAYDVVDVLFDGVALHRLSLPHITTGNTHGTGCTLASAIASGLAKGLPLLEAVWQVGR